MFVYKGSDINKASEKLDDYTIDAKEGAIIITFPFYKDKQSKFNLEYKCTNCERNKQDFWSLSGLVPYAALMAFIFLMLLY